MHSFTALVAVFVTGVAGHGYLTGFRVNGAYHQGWDPGFRFRPASQIPTVAGWSTHTGDGGELWGYVGPANYSTPDIICHEGAKPAPIAVSAPAGASIDLLWNTWPTSHKGPIITSRPLHINLRHHGQRIPLLLPIAASGHKQGFNPGTWVTDDMIANNFTSTVTLPANIAPGQYVLRHEILALHIVNETQNYPQCISLDVMGGGSAEPDGTKGEELYKQDEPGIRFNIYVPFSTYPLPGPAVYTAAVGGDAGGGSGNHRDGGSAESADVQPTSTAEAQTTPTSLAALQAASTPASAPTTLEKVTRPCQTAHTAVETDVVLVTATEVVTVLATAAA